MTVTYTAQVASCKRFGCFWKLLFRWKGSIYKLLWPNFTVYIMMYTTLSICYRFLLDEHQQTVFEKLSIHCQTYGDLIPVSFVLGFYISIVIKRWWDQYLCIPWPDPLAILVSAFIWGQDERSRMMRRTVMRYANLSFVIALRMMCPSVKKRFPTLDHLVNAGFMTNKEKKIFENLETRTAHPKYWLPLVWSIHIVNTAHREDRIRDDFGSITLIKGINRFRTGCGSLLNYDWISIPLVYSQVVTLAVYTYFLATLMGNQYLNPAKGYPNHSIDLVVPIFTLLQFFFYMGWLLVAETLVNPFGEDDDDFEVNWLIDRNIQMSYLIVDEIHEDYPELEKDKYWDEVVPTELPYTEAAKQYYTEPFLGSTRDVDVPLDQRGFVLMSMINDPEVPLKQILLTSERKETTPVQIKSALATKVLDSNVSSLRDNIKSNSIISLLKRNLYGANSKRSITSSDTGYARRKNMAISRVSGSPECSVASTYRKNFNDFSEDIFWMSDFSILDRPKFKGSHDEHLSSILSVEKLTQTIKSQSYHQNVQQHEKIKKAANSWHGQGIDEGKVGQGEQVSKKDESSLSVSSNSNRENPMDRTSHDELPDPIVEMNAFERLEEKASVETIKEVEMSEKDHLVPLDQQILLEENAEEPKQEPIQMVYHAENTSGTSTEPISFQPVTTPIVIPGSIVKNDHFSLPIIEEAENDVENQLSEEDIDEEKCE